MTATATAERSQIDVNNLILQWLREGKEPTQISRLLAKAPYGVTVTPTNIRNRRARSGIPRMVPDHSRYIPWQISDSSGDHNCWPAQMLRLLSLRSQGLPLSQSPDRAKKLSRSLENWLLKLTEKDEVVTYIQGAGWRYVKRLDTDDPDSVITLRDL